MAKGKTTKFVVILFLMILGGVGWLGWQVYSTYQIANRVIDRDARMMGAREFATMKRSAILINTCRGPVVDEAALQVALASGQIAAAGLDVMVEEPPAANHPLFGLENITITPHSAGPTWENWAKAFRNAFDNVQRVAAGRKPLWVIPELQDLL